MQARRDQTTKIADENRALQQAFLNELDEKLWSSADKLRQQLDAANLNPPNITLTHKPT